MAHKVRVNAGQSQIALPNGEVYSGGDDGVEVVLTDAEFDALRESLFPAVLTDLGEESEGGGSAVEVYGASYYNVYWELDAGVIQPNEAKSPDAIFGGEGVVNSTPPELADAIGLGFASPSEGQPVQGRVTRKGIYNCFFEVRWPAGTGDVRSMVVNYPGTLLGEGLRGVSLDYSNYVISVQNTAAEVAAGNGYQSIARLTVLVSEASEELPGFFAVQLLHDNPTPLEIEAGNAYCWLEPQVLF